MITNEKIKFHIPLIVIIISVFSLYFLDMDRRETAFFFVGLVSAICSGIGIYLLRKTQKIYEKILRGIYWTTFILSLCLLVLFALLFIPIWLHDAGFFTIPIGPYGRRL